MSNRKPAPYSGRFEEDFRKGANHPPRKTSNPNDELKRTNARKCEDYEMSNNNQNNAAPKLTPEEEIAMLRSQLDGLRATVERLAGKARDDASEKSTQGVPEVDEGMSTLTKVGLWTLGLGAAAAVGVYAYAHFAAEGTDEVALAAIGLAGEAAANMSDVTMAAVTA